MLFIFIYIYIYISFSYILEKDLRKDYNKREKLNEIK